VQQIAAHKSQKMNLAGQSLGKLDADRANLANAQPPQTVSQLN
jgi:hypothetical protein